VCFAEMVFNVPGNRHDIGFWFVDFLLGVIAAKPTRWAPSGGGSFGLNIIAMIPKPSIALSNSS
jgi:hypothetical protein